MVEMETKNHPSESKLEQFLIQFAVGFPVMMKVSHLNILMPLIFSQATSKLLQQICDHVVTSKFHLSCAVRYRAAAKLQMFGAKSRGCYSRSQRCELLAMQSSLTSTGRTIIDDYKQTPASSFGF